MAEKEIIRDELGRIVPGSASLNPDGRPLGAKSFTSLVVEAMERKMAGSDYSRNDFLAEALAELMVTGKFTTVEGAEIRPRSGDFLNFLLSVWKKLEPGTTAIDITTGGKRLDFSRMEDDELRRIIEGTIGSSFSSDGGGRIEGAETEDSEPVTFVEGLSSDDSPEDVLLDEAAS